MDIAGLIIDMPSPRKLWVARKKFVCDTTKIYFDTLYAGCIAPKHFYPICNTFLLFFLFVFLILSVHNHHGKSVVKVTNKVTSV